MIIGGAGSLPEPFAEEHIWVPHDGCGGELVCPLRQEPHLGAFLPFGAWVSPWGRS